VACCTSIRSARIAAPASIRSRNAGGSARRVVYDRGFDDLVRLVREGEGPANRTYEREQSAEDSLFSRRDGRPLRKLNEERLRAYESLGVRVRVVNSGSNTVVIGGSDRVGPGSSSCEPCRQLVGRTYEAREAPVLPLERCRSRPTGICVCRYELLPPV